MMQIFSELFPNNALSDLSKTRTGRYDLDSDCSPLFLYIGTICANFHIAGNLPLNSDC
jgi:hypothetical protein